MITPERPKTFDDLVTFSTMRIIDAITRGTGLRSAVFQILDYAIRWHIENENEKPPGASTMEQIYSALDDVNDLGGPAHVRIKALIEQRTTPQERMRRRESV